MTLMLAAGTAVAAALALVIVLAIYLAARGPARAGLASLGVAAALAAPAAGIGAASWLLIDSFSGMALEGSGGMAVVLGACTQAATLIRAGCGAAAVILVVATVLGWVGRGEPGSLPPASMRRLAVLALPAVLAPALVGGALEYSRRTRNTIIDVVRAPEPAKPAEPPDPDAPEPRPERLAGSIAETAQSLAVGLTIGMIGVPFFVLVLAGWASATAILGWRTRVPTAFAAVLSVWMLLQALLWAGAIFLFRTPAA